MIRKLLYDRLNFEFNPPGTIPADSIIAVGLVLAVTILNTAPGEVKFLRAAVGIPVLLFVPGYVFIAMAFPRRYRTGNVESSVHTKMGSGVRDGGRINLRERVALSFAMSAILIPVIGLLTIWYVGSLSTESVLISLNAFVILGIIVATIRRNSLPQQERFQIPYRRWQRAIRTRLADTENTLGTGVSVLLFLTILVAVFTMGFTLLAPADEMAYTSTTVLTESSDGDLVAGEYPTEFTRGEGEPLVFRIENNEGAPTAYSVVVELQRVQIEGDTVTVTAEERLLEQQSVVGAGKTWTIPHRVTPSMVGEDLRLAYYVYRDDPPVDANDENAYRRAHIWISVSEGE